MTNIKDIVKDFWLGPKIEECIDSTVGQIHLLKQIETRWGKNMAKNTNLDRDLMTFARWHMAGFRILPQEKALIGVRWDPPHNLGPKTQIRKPRPVYLYHRHQVKRVRY
ncbi:MAG: hypothetical protein NTY66_03650 [Candidatus Vogelbacteria bacterium]|nr:hypothetical protein [Candidatus Vogelbacteria bacterium]